MSLRINWDAHVRDAGPEGLASGLACVAHRGAWSLTTTGAFPELAALFRTLEERLESHRSGARTMDVAELEAARAEVERLVNAVRVIALT